MVKAILLVNFLCLIACGQQNGTTSNRGQVADSLVPLSKEQNMDTVFFWKIMDNAFSKAKFDSKLKEQAILDQLIELTPEQIQQFEIIFQQMNLKANTWNNFAAHTIIAQGSSDDTFFYFRCWLISLGRVNFDNTLKNPDHLAELEIPVNKKWGYGEVMFEELISISDHAYSIVTGKQIEDETFPRAHATKKGVFYDSGGEMKGKEWTDDELPKIAPKLFKIFGKN